jgi:hypothetical protein
MPRSLFNPEIIPHLHSRLPTNHHLVLSRSLLSTGFLDHRGWMGAGHQHCHTTRVSFAVVFRPQLLSPLRWGPENENILFSPLRPLWPMFHAQVRWMNLKAEVNICCVACHALVEVVCPRSGCFGRCGDSSDGADWITCDRNPRGPDFRHL